MIKYILGIDPGVTGAYVILSKKKKTIKVCKLFKDFETVLEDIEPYLSNLVACIEKVGAMPNQGSVSTGTFMKNAGGWEGFLAALKVPRTYVTTQVWLKAVLDTQAPKVSAAGLEGKKLAKVRAQNRKIGKMHTTAFVLRVLPASKKYLKLKKDQDKADAICIALYKRKQMGYCD